MGPLFVLWGISVCVGAVALGESGSLDAQFTVAGERVIIDGIEVFRVERDGPHIGLTWALEPSPNLDPTTAALHYELQRSDSLDFNDPEVLYRGGAQASFRSGLVEGDYYYRVRAVHTGSEQIGEWSDVLHVAVVYQSMGRAWFLFAVGGVVMSATLALIVVGARNDVDEAAENSDSASTEGHA